MQRSYFVGSEELLRRFGGVTPQMRRSYSVGAEEILHRFGGVTPLVRMSQSVGAEELLRWGVTPQMQRSHSVGAEESLRRWGGVTPSVWRSYSVEELLRRCGGVTFKRIHTHVADDQEMHDFDKKDEMFWINVLGRIKMVFVFYVKQQLPHRAIYSKKYYSIITRTRI